MRVILRLVAIVIWWEIIGTMRLIWGFWRLGNLSPLMMDGTVGMVTALGWALTLTVGPFAAIQLWQLRESGRTPSLLLAVYAILYYAVAWLLVRQTDADTPKVWLAIMSNTLVRY